jgi:hypothetical protein
MSAFGGKADIAFTQRSLIDHPEMSNTKARAFTALFVPCGVIEVPRR